jgi:hypothetical protein
MRDFKRFVKGVTFKPNDGGSNPIGDLSGVLTSADNGSVYHYQNKLKAFLDGVEREVITNDQTQTITNKTIDADSNTITNIENADIKAGAAIEESKLALDYSTSGLNTAITDHIADAVDAHDATAISFDNTTSGLTATEVQAAIDEVEGRLDTAETTISDHISDATDAHDASAISNIPAGNLAATDVQAALNELQSDLDTRALASDLTDHINDTTDAHDATAISFDNVASGLTATEVQGAIDELDGRLDTVETAAGDAQTDIDNHIADATDAHDASAISNVPAGNLAATDVQAALNELQSDVDSRALDSDLTNHISDTEAHGATGAVVGTTNTQTLTNKTLDGASIESPIRSDVKKDTKANLETYATTATDGQLCFATDEQIMYQVVDNALTEVGAGGGVGSVDIMFADTFDSTAIAEYTTSGTVALTESAVEVLQGKKSLKITHTGGASAERIIPVDIKFRNKNVTFSFDVESDALSGNLTLTVVDETNTVTLVNAESIQPQGTLDTSIKRSVSFIIPDDCEELKYTFNAVSESGKISIIDNVVIELTQTAKMSTTIEVPVVTQSQSYTPSFQGFGSPTNVEIQYQISGDIVRIWGKFTSGISTAVEARIGLPNNLVSAGVSKIPSIRFAGSARRGIADTAIYNTLIEPSVNYITVSRATGSDSPLSKLNGSGLLSSGQVLSFEATIPCADLPMTETQEVSLAQAVLKQESDSQMTWQGFAGRGSTRTRIIYFTNARSMEGSGISFTSDTTNGLEVTIQEDGYYTIDLNTHSNVSATSFIGIGKNLSDFTTAISSRTTDPSVLKAVAQTTDTSTRISGTVSWSGPLKAGDKIYPMSDLTPSESLATAYFSISKAGSLKQVNVTENQKIEIPTSELRMEGASTRGTGAETFTVKFANIAKLRGGAFELDNSNATIVTMKKKGLLAVTCNLNTTAVNQGIRITLNQAINTANPLASEIQSFTQSYTSTPDNTLSAVFHVNVGDKVRVNTDNNVFNSTRNNLNLSFQEQEIAVSVTNVLPQFSESDSSVRVDTANGYGSTATKIRRFSNVRDNLGSAITYADSATNGSSFTVNEDGIYNVSYTEYTTLASALGLTLNSANLTTSVNVLSLNSNNEVLALSNTPTGGISNTSWQGYLQKGDVIRPHTTGDTSPDNDPIKFTISKVGKPNVTGVDVTPFAKIEYEVSQDIFLSNVSSLSSANISGPLTRNSNTGILSYNSTTGVYTALKNCEVNCSYSALNVNNAAITITIEAKGGEVSRATAGVSAGFGVTTSASFNLVAGETFNFTIGGNAGNTHKISVTATELRDAYQVIGGGVENTYSARITSAGAITSQSYPFIASVTKGAAGVYTLNLVAGFFTEAFSAVVTPENSVGNGYGRVTSTTSTASILMINTSGAQTDMAFNITVTRQGSDYRTPSKAIGLPQQRIAIITDRKANNVAAQVISTTYIAKHINTLIDPTGLIQNPASFTGTGGTNTSVVLNAGTYKVSAMGQITSGPGNVFSKIRLYNVTDASVIQLGSSAFSAGSSGDDSSAPSFVEAYFTLTAQKTLELQHRVNSGSKTAGAATNFGEDELYTTMVIEKVEE